MGAALAANLPAARELFDRAAAILGYDLLRLCVDGPEDKLDSTAYSQPALFCVVWRQRRSGMRAERSMPRDRRLSLGEYTARFAGPRLRGGLRVVANGRAMQALRRRAERHGQLARARARQDQ
jgi:[acyl-carrier-protein] S-malonyltransferase